MKTVFRVAMPVLVAGALAAACQTVQTTQSGAVGVQRSQLMMVSAQEVEQASNQQYQQMLAEARRKNALDRDPAAVQRMRRIVSRLSAQTGAFRPDAPSWAWEVHVFTSAELNAWCMAGGKMAIYTGLIERLALSDDEIAAVMGHEIAHALREHARERASEQLGAQVLLSGAVMAIGGGQASMDLGGLFYKTFFGLPNSRLHETEADRIGVELAARAGYDPRAAMSLWRKMMANGGSRGPEFLSTHPSPETRLSDLEVYSARVMPLYEQARARR